MTGYIMEIQIACHEPIPAELATFEKGAVTLAEGKTMWDQKPSTPSWATLRGWRCKGIEMKYALLVGGESEGLMLNDLHPHPLSILNFKFIIRKHTL